jgi:GrpB-like predicted nucleotidyltransferase (UPF0157 family)
VIEIHDHKPTWAVEFAALGKALRQALGSDALRIDHIGSTSVLGLAAKDIIDMQLSVESLKGSLVSTIEASGFMGRPDIESDHVPELADASPEEWQKMYFCELEGQRAVHLHVRVAGRANQRYALLFRDYLRSHPAAAASYGELKRRLAAQIDNSDVYAYVKDPACDLIMQAAEVWASTTAWTPGASDA